MSKYGQYCPVARSLEILGDRWTLLIVRDMLFGAKHFNELERGLPGISRSLLTTRMQQLQQAGIIKKHLNDAGRNTTEYHLTQAGQELLNIIIALQVWGDAWAFGDPTPEELNPVLLMWQMRSRVKVDQLPEFRVVVQYDFCGAMRATFWLILTTEDVALCLTDPGYEINLLITADLVATFKLWAGRINYQEALDDCLIKVDGIPGLVDAFPKWFGWDGAAPEVNN